MRHVEAKNFIREANSLDCWSSEKDLFIYYRSCAKVGQWWRASDEEVAGDLGLSRSRVTEARGRMRDRGWIECRRGGYVRVLKDFETGRVFPAETGGGKGDENVGAPTIEEAENVGTPTIETDPNVGTPTKNVGSPTINVGAPTINVGAPTIPLEPPIRNKGNVEEETLRGKYKRTLLSGETPDFNDFVLKNPHDDAALRALIRDKIGVKRRVLAITAAEWALMLAVFDDWCFVFKKPKTARLNAQRGRAILDRIRSPLEYTFVEFQKALRGCARSPMHNGAEKGVVYDDLELIFRDDGQMDKMIGYFETWKSGQATEIHDGTGPPATDEPADELPDCGECKNERAVLTVVDPDAEFSFQREMNIPCRACRPQDHAAAMADYGPKVKYANSS